MFQRIEKWVTGNFPWVSFAALSIGILVDPVSRFFNPLIYYTLMVVLFFNFVKLDLESLIHEVRSWPYQIYFTFFTLIGLPLLMYGVGWAAARLLDLPSGTTMGVLLFFAAPTAAIAPTLTLLFKGRFERTLLNVFLTSLLVPFTLPFLIFLLEKKSVQLDYLHMMLRLSVMVFIPLMLAMLLRRFFPPLDASLKKHAPFFSIFFLTFLTMGGVSGLRTFLAGNPGIVLHFLLLISFLMLLSFGFSWFLTFKKAPADRLTLAIVSTWTNISLSLVVANDFFRDTMPLALLFIAVSSLPWHFSFFPAKWAISRLMKSSRPL